MNRFPAAPLGVLASISLAVSGCGGPSAASGPAIMVDGSSTVFPISVAAQEAYDAVSPGARIIVSSRGTGSGFGGFIEGTVDIVDASREAKPEEEADARAKGFNWTRFLVAHDGITVVVHPSNDFVEALSVDQLKKLFAVEGPASRWSELDPAWPDRAINLYTPDDDSGTYEFFAGAIVGGKAHRKDVQASADDNTLVTGVANDADGLGYFGYSYFVENEDKLRAVPIRATADAEPVMPGPESIHSGAYAPLSRPLYIYVKNTTLKRPDGAAFVRFYLEHAAELAEKAGYVAPTEEERADNSSAFSAAVGESARAAE